MRELTDVFKALSDPNRLRILKMLGIRPLCVCEMTSILKLAPSTVSKHLSILKNARLVFDQKEDKWVNYHLNWATQQPAVRQLIPLLEEWLKDDAVIKRDAEQARVVDRNAL